MSSVLGIVCRIFIGIVGAWFGWLAIRSLAFLVGHKFEWAPVIASTLFVTICFFCLLLAWRGGKEAGRIVPAVIVGIGIGLVGGVAAFFLSGDTSNFPLRALSAFSAAAALGFVFGSLGSYAWQLATGRPFF